MMARRVPSGRIRPRWYGTITCLPVAGFRHFWWLPELPAILNPPRSRMAMTSSALRRGVPRSPNHHLDEFGILRQVDVGRGEIESNGILDIATCFCFGFACRSASRQFRADRRPALGNWIIFEDNAELHTLSIRRVRFRHGWQPASEHRGYRGQRAFPRRSAASDADTRLCFSPALGHAPGSCFVVG
jgi:hypothetical protein